MRSRVCRVLLMVPFLLVGSGALATAAPAEVCPNEQLRAREVYALRLPDCRAYEQVTPVDKDGTTPGGFSSAVQASPAGNRIVFLVPANMPGAQGASAPPLFLTTRIGEGWLPPQGLLAPSPPGVEDAVLGWSEDLSEVALKARLATDESESLYLRDSSTGSYRLAVPGLGLEGVHLAGFTADDAHLIFETTAQLLPSAITGKTNLYELSVSNGSLSLAGVLPANEGGEAPPGGSFAGPYDYALAPDTSTGGATRTYYTQGTISSSGSRIVFTAGGTGKIYVREPEAKPAKTIAVSPGQAEWRATTPDGRYVFYTEGEKLYRFDVGNETREELAGAGAAVQGTLGVSADGSYVYFIGNGVLASNEGAHGSHASPGNCKGIEESKTCNLYEWDASKPLAEQLSFIAPQNTNVLNGHGGDANNWFPLANPGGSGGEKSSRVTPDGKTLLFVSHLQLTGYDNTDASTGQPDDELYRYDATRPVSSNNPACVSCNPTGVRPTASPTLRSLSATVQVKPEPILTRNLSSDGSRIFFETPEKLAAQDSNGVQDVYEWEREGIGSCRPSSEGFSESSGGCLYLVSTGRSPEGSFFADASASGDDVFFFTGQPLVGQDQDQLVDVYDARAGGGIAAQNQSPPAPCEGEACRGASGAPPVFGVPSSVMFSGPGNSPPPVAEPPVKPKQKSLTRAQKLAKALRACAKKPRHQRPTCVKQAKRKYGGRSIASKRNRKGNR